MSHLHVVGTEPVRPQSLRVDRHEDTPEYIADLELITRNVLAPAQVGTAELLDGLTRRDKDVTIAALRRLLAAGLLARDLAERLERAG